MASEEDTGCQCQIFGKILSPKAYMKVISHDLRKEILHKLHILTLDLPISKKQIADAMGIHYEVVNYQLNEHLKDFWVVKHREKIRGTYKEYIAPEMPNTVYLNMGSEKTLYIIDPLANLIGRIKDVGTRCDQCSTDVRNRCLNEIQNQKCFLAGKRELVKREKVLEDNDRRRPFTPVDYMLVCTVAKSLDKETCIVQLNQCACPFIEKLRSEILALQKSNYTDC